nr:zinc finger, CCHC-type [Tanacetum cinerariifolium]
MTSSITRFDIEKFDGKNDLRLWQIKMCVLMVQQICDDALDTLPTYMEAGLKATLIKKAYSALIICFGDRVLRKVTKKTTAAEIEDEDQALMLFTSLPSSYENFLKTLLFERESLTMEDVLVTLNSKELKKRTGGIKEEYGDGLYVRRRGSSEERLSNEKVKWVLQEGSYHMTHKRDLLYDFKGFDDGSVQLGDNRICLIKTTKKIKIQLHDGSSFILEDVRYVLGLRRSLISLDTLEKRLYCEDADGQNQSDQRELKEIMELRFFRLVTMMISGSKMAGGQTT